MIRPLFFVPYSDDIRNIFYFLSLFVIVQFLCQILQCDQENREVAVDEYNQNVFSKQRVKSDKKKHL